MSNAHPTSTTSECLQRQRSNSRCDVALDERHRKTFSHCREKPIPVGRQKPLFCVALRRGIQEFLHWDLCLRDSSSNCGIANATAKRIKRAGVETLDCFPQGGVLDPYMMRPWIRCLDTPLVGSSQLVLSPLVRTQTYADKTSRTHCVVHTNTRTHARGRCHQEWAVSAEIIPRRAVLKLLGTWHDVTQDAASAERRGAQ